MPKTAYPPLLPPDDCDAIDQSLSEVAGELKAGNLFVTGGDGFFGRWLVASFIHLNRGASLNARMTVHSRDRWRILASSIVRFGSLQATCVISLFLKAISHA